MEHFVELLGFEVLGVHTVTVRGVVDEDDAQFAFYL
jgi:hypothetical protein